MMYASSLNDLIFFMTAPFQRIRIRSCFSKIWTLKMFLHLIDGLEMIPPRRQKKNGITHCILRTSQFVSSMWPFTLNWQYQSFMVQSLVCVIVCQWTSLNAARWLGNQQYKKKRLKDSHPE